jgi:4-hydroxybenzoate polyprenyltransferase
MLAFQTSIGAVNDLMDVQRDRLGKPGKPLVTGAISRRAAGAWAAVTLAVAFGLALSSGLGTALVGGLGVGLGYAYDVRMSRTALSWLPLALALPLVPVFAWLGATGTVPAGLGGLVAAAMSAGSGLMIGNGLVDLERDRAARKATVAVVLGSRLGWIAHAAAIAVAAGLAWLLAPVPVTGSALAGVRSAGLPVATLAVSLGACLVAFPSPRIRERGWELETIGVGLLGLAWLAGTASIAGGAGG